MGFVFHNKQHSSKKRRNIEKMLLRKHHNVQIVIIIKLYPGLLFREKTKTNQKMEEKVGYW